jgi:hypothetical protein
LKSDNGGDLGSSSWDDLNYPARMATLMAARLPLLQYDNQGSVVATQTLARKLGIGIFVKNLEQLGTQLRDKNHLSEIRANVERHRPLFTFDHHADELLAFFTRVISARSGGSTIVGSSFTSTKEH